MSIQKWIATVLVATLGTAQADTALLNASYDVAREFYKEYNPLFVAYWAKKTGETVTLNTSHGPSSKQANAVMNGLEADVVALNQATDVQFLVDGGLIAKNWKQRLPHNSAPFSSTTLFVVRQGNPKGIKDWGDLAKPGVQVIVPNPKTSGNGRYSYLAAWAWAKHQAGGTDAKAESFVTSLFKNVPILDAGGRAATTTFAQRELGDVLLTFENEVYLIEKEFGANKYDIVYPSSSVLAELPVAVVDKVVDKKGTRKQAEAFVQYLYSPEAQTLAAKQRLRPTDAKVLAAHAGLLKPIQLFTVEQEFGGWGKAQKDHFADGGTFDRVILKAKP